jgi:hypothetical protein
MGPTIQWQEDQHQAYFNMVDTVTPQLRKSLLRVTWEDIKGKRSTVNAMEIIPVENRWYGTLYCATLNSLYHLEDDLLSPVHIYTLVSALGGVLLPLLDDHGLEVLALGHLALDLGDHSLEVWCVLWRCQSATVSSLRGSPYLLRLGPLLLGQKLVGHGELP